MTVLAVLSFQLTTETTSGAMFYSSEVTYQILMVDPADGFNIDGISTKWLPSGEYLTSHPSAALQGLHAPHFAAFKVAIRQSVL